MKRGIQPFGMCKLQKVFAMPFGKQMGILFEGTLFEWFQRETQSDTTHLGVPLFKDKPMCQKGPAKWVRFPFGCA